MTSEQTKMVLAVLSAAFPHARADENTVTVYCEALADLPFELADQAARSLILTMRFMPTIAEIRERCVEISGGGSGAGGSGTTGLEAWGIVRKAIGKHGFYKTPGVDFHWDDPIIKLVVEAIGWRELCCGDIDNQVADRARFVQAYEQIGRETLRARQAGGLLPSRVEPRQLAAPRDTMQPLAKLLPALPAPSVKLGNLMPWEEDDGDR